MMLICRDVSMLGQHSHLIAAQGEKEKLYKAPEETKTASVSEGLHRQ